MMIEKPKTNIEDLLKNPPNGKYLKVVAPMVRYSRLEFRNLVRKYGADLTFTPMVIANSFCRSEKCRQSEFTTNAIDTPLIVQFAASNETDYKSATEMVQKYADGVDLNCGCPQQWARQEGYGSYLLTKPEVIEDLVKSVRRNVPSSFSVSVKIRLLNKNIKDTIDLCRKLESLNVTFLTVHGRTRQEKSSADNPVKVDAIAEIKKSLKIPLIFNGDVCSLKRADEFYEATKCDGMMSARGILECPALFDGHTKTPLSVVQDWIDIENQQKDKMTFQNFHHHLSFMIENIVKKSERIQFDDLTKKDQVREYVKEKFGIEPQPIDYPENIECIYDDSNYMKLINQKDFWSSEYSTESSHGKYFLSKLYNKSKPKQDENFDYLDNMDNLLIFD